MVLGLLQASATVTQVWPVVMATLALAAASWVVLKLRYLFSLGSDGRAAEISTLLKMAVARAVFAVGSVYRGVRFEAVTDAATAMLVLKQSTVKGIGLEREVAVPAWAPVLSLESVDGELWVELRARFGQLLAVLPPLTQLQERFRDHARTLVASGAVVDAEAVATLTCRSFVEFLFGVEWVPATHAVLVAASWEWRREIALRGRADPEVKREAVRVLVEELLPACPRLWALFGERWRRPEFYSVIMQPFIISPCINVGDIAVALQTHPTLSAEDAIRRMHPFPILERYVAADVRCPRSGSVLVRGGSQVVMFTSDFEGSWPVFGAGDRSCAGMHIALPLIRALQAELVGTPSFRPEEGHRYSGRNNDDKMSPAELWYLLRTVARAVVTFDRAADDAYLLGLRRAAEAEKSN